MTEDNKKIITVTFALTSVLIGIVVSLLLGVLAANFAVIARIESSPELSNGIPVAIGIIVFAILQFNKKCVDFLDGVIAEMKKVVWPSRKDTWLMTVVVVITLIFSGIVVGLYDMFWAKAVALLVK